MIYSLKNGLTEIDNIKNGGQFACYLTYSQLEENKSCLNFQTLCLRTAAT